MTTPPAAPLESASPPPLPSPRTRWAAVVWGLTFAAIAAAGWAVTSSTRATATLIDTIADAKVGPAVAVGLLVVGALVAVAGVAGLLRTAQRSLAARRLHQSTHESTRQT